MLIRWAADRPVRLQDNAAHPHVRLRIPPCRQVLRRRILEVGSTEALPYFPPSLPRGCESVLEKCAGTGCMPSPETRMCRARGRSGHGISLACSRSLGQSTFAFGRGDLCGQVVRLGSWDYELPCAPPLCRRWQRAGADLLPATLGDSHYAPSGSNEPAARPSGSRRRPQASPPIKADSVPTCRLRSVPFVSSSNPTRDCAAASLWTRTPCQSTRVPDSACWS